MVFKLGNRNEKESEIQISNNLNIKIQIHIKKILYYIAFPILFNLNFDLYALQKRNCQATRLLLSAKSSKVDKPPVTFKVNTQMCAA